MSCPECDKLSQAAIQMAATSILAVPGVAGPRVIKERRGTCKVCHHAQIAHSELPSWANFSRCQLCNCSLAEKTKMAAAVCPDQPPKWVG